MIPKNIRPGATAEGLTGETRQFTIKANGKAFRSLIDSLYSNKVLAVVRELCSNAQDAHIAAGQTRPFDVTIPTHLEPIFAVRDYGIGMSHDDVMVLYTTIFESTKEDTNEQTGQLGLGSKSPFAYTDSFQVTSFTGPQYDEATQTISRGEKRMYVTHLATDGIPCITHVGNQPCDEPRGILVSFAAKRESIKQFQKEMRFVAMGYDTPPNVTGMEVALPEPRMSGTNWAIYPSGEFITNESGYHHFIRMGSALYPSNTNFPHVGYGYSTVVNIPIGTANVTSSRDALSYDYETRQAIAGIHQAAYTELVAQMEADAALAVTRVEKAKVWLKYTGILDNLKGNTVVSLRNDDYEPDTDTDRNDSLLTSQPGDTLQMALHYGKSGNARHTGGRWTQGIDVSVLPKMILIVDDQFNKTVRRKIRINKFADMHRHSPTYLIKSYDKEHMVLGVEWITECLELTDAQIINVADLTDYPPDRKPCAAGTPATGPRRLGANQFWMRRNSGYIQSEIYGTSYRRGPGEWPNNMQSAMRTAGLYPNWDDIFWVTDRQIEAAAKKKVNPLPKAQQLDIAVEKTVIKLAKKAPVEQALEYNAIQEGLGRYNANLRLVIDKFFPHIKITQPEAERALSLAHRAKISLQTKAIGDKVNATIIELTAQYPLLFGKTDRRYYEQYIQAIQTQKEAAAQ